MNQKPRLKNSTPPYLPLNQAVPREFYWWMVLGASIVMAFVYMVWLEVRQVSAYPFALHWSEGNRFYDYSLIFGKTLYQYPGELKTPYFAPGRYGLWGLWFLVQGTPIWLHRAWNAVLWLLPSLGMGWIVTRAIENKFVRLIFSLWVGIFLYQGPVYAPLLLVAMLVLGFEHIPLKYRYLILGAASLYAGISRFTWSAAPGIWGVLLALFSRSAQGRGEQKHDLLGLTALGLVGSLPGIIVNLVYSSHNETALTFDQPLLWYRLLPNATYAPGILGGILIATGGLVAILIWQIAKRRLVLGGLQIFGVFVALLGTFIGGVLVSVKIGGGSNLHNFDLYFVTLIILLKCWLDRGTPETSIWPIGMQIVLALVVLIPVWQVLSQDAPLKVSNSEITQAAFARVQTEVHQAASQGEVLFMDQRQLLTFGNIKRVELVPEYEKKFMMDQAMAGNQAYYEVFYADLEASRFELILSEPLFVNYKDRSEPFSEENNAWVSWVAEKVLCYYQPIITLKEVGIQLLVPRDSRVDCR